MATMKFGARRLGSVDRCPGEAGIALRGGNVRLVSKCKVWRSRPADIGFARTKLHQLRLKPARPGRWTDGWPTDAHRPKQLVARLPPPDPLTVMDHAAAREKTLARYAVVKVT
jgi:hypothetical protein